jgi:hypothetical protein
VNLGTRIKVWFAVRKIRQRFVAWLEERIGRPLTREESRMFKNWQTSLIGIVMAAVQLHQGGMTWGNAIIAGLMAALGFAAKDHNVTGGSVQQ